MQRYRNNVIILAITALSLCSCEHKDLIEDLTARVHITFDWSETRSEEGEESPKSMRVIFYPIEAEVSQPLMYDIVGNERNITLPFGTYDVLAFNNDSEHNNIVYQTERDSIRSTNLKADTRALLQIKKAQPDSLTEIIDYPDEIYKATREQYLVPEDMENRQQELVMQPLKMLYRVHMRIKVKGLKYCYQVKGVITNVAQSIYLWSGFLSPESTNMYFSCEMTDSAVIADFPIYGPSSAVGRSRTTRDYLETRNNPDLPIVRSVEEMTTEEKNTHNTITLYFWLYGGKTMTTFDISPNVLEAYKRDSRDIYIDDELDFDLQGRISERSNFDLEIQEWEEIHKEIGM